MATGNVRKMICIDPDYIMGFCHKYCKKNNVKMGDLGEMLGHSICYIQTSCRQGKMPQAELELLSFKTGLDIQKATSINNADNSKHKEDMTTDEKLDYIMEMCESILEYIEAK